MTTAESNASSHASMYALSHRRFTLCEIKCSRCSPNRTACFLAIHDWR